MTIIQNFGRIATFLQQQVADLILMSILADEIIVKPVVADSAAAQPDAIYRVVRRLQVQQVETPHFCVFLSFCRKSGLK